MSRYPARVVEYYTLFLVRMHPSQNKFAEGDERLPQQCHMQCAPTSASALLRCTLTMLTGLRSNVFRASWVWVVGVVTSETTTPTSCGVLALALL